MTIVDEKEILEVEKIKAEIAKLPLDMEKLRQDIAMDMKRFDLELSKKSYEAWRLSFYGIAVGFGGTFALAKTISLMGW